jgi:hypothetical protein
MATSKTKVVKSPFPAVQGSGSATTTPNYPDSGSGYSGYSKVPINGGAYELKKQEKMHFIKLIGGGSVAGNYLVVTFVGVKFFMTNLSVYLSGVGSPLNYYILDDPSGTRNVFNGLEYGATFQEKTDFYSFDNNPSQLNNQIIVQIDRNLAASEVLNFNFWGYFENL